MIPSSTSASLQDKLQRLRLAGIPFIRTQKNIDDLDARVNKGILKFVSDVYFWDRQLTSDENLQKTRHPVEIANLNTVFLVKDDATPLYVIGLRLLTQKNIKIKNLDYEGYSSIRERRIQLFKSFSETIIHQNRHRNQYFNLPISDVLQSPYPLPQHYLKNIHYICYRYQKPVVEFRNGNVIIHNHKQLNKVMNDKRNTHWVREDRFTVKMIDKAIDEKMISKDHRDKLMDYVGLSIKDALLDISTTRVNVRRWHQIQRDELSLPMIQSIKNTVEFLLWAYFDQQRLKFGERQDPKGIKHLKQPLKKICIQCIAYDIASIFKFLRGKIPLQSLGVNKNNAYTILIILKIIDWETSATNCISYNPATFVEGKDAQLRSRIAKCLPTITLHEVFLRTLIPGKLNDVRYWLGPNWTCEMAAQIGRSCVIARVNADALRRRLPGVFYGIRANSAMCKSSMLLKEFGEASKWFQTPDKHKWNLRQLPFFPGEVLLNHQVHPVGLELYISMINELKKIPGMSYGLDERLLYPKVLLERLIYPAEVHNGRVRLRDLAARRLTPSLLRMLLRKPWGKEPAQATWVLVGGHKDSIIYRKAIIDIVRERDVVTEYRLYLDGKIVAEKKGKAWHIYDQKGYRDCIEPPVDLDDQIYEDLSQIITPELIQHAVMNKYIYPWQAQELVGWIGFPLGKAVDMNAKGESFR